MNEEMYLELRRMILERNIFHSRMGHTEAAIAYASVAEMLEVAMLGDWERLYQFDYYHDEDADMEDPEEAVKEILTSAPMGMVEIETYNPNYGFEVPLDYEYLFGGYTYDC